MAYNKNLSGDLAANYTMSDEQRDELLAQMLKSIASATNTAGDASSHANSALIQIEQLTGIVIKSGNATGTFVLTCTVEEVDGEIEKNYAWVSASSLNVSANEDVVETPSDGEGGGE